MKTQEKKNLFTLAIIFLTVTSLAIANAGSPMLLFSMLHLVLLNTVIGVVESGIVTTMKVPNKTWALILANYISMFIGFYLIAPYFSSISGNQDFWGVNTRLGNYELNGFFIGIIASYLATLIIELPFFYGAVRNKVQRNQILIPFFVANTVTNILMFLVYYLIASKGEHW